MRRKYEISEIASDESLINLTPLIDVVFVVLITFILIAPLIELDKISLATKTHTQSSQEAFKQSPIQIYVYEDNSIWINRQKIPLPQLRQKLTELFAQYPSAIPRLFQDKQATFGTYQKVKDTVETIGFSQLDVILKTE